MSRMSSNRYPTAPDTDRNEGIISGKGGLVERTVQSIAGLSHERVATAPFSSGVELGLDERSDSDAFNGSFRLMLSTGPDVSNSLAAEGNVIIDSHSQAALTFMAAFLLCIVVLIRIMNLDLFCSSYSD